MEAIKRQLRLHWLIDWLSDWLIDWILSYVPLQIIYGYAETNDNDKIDNNTVLYFKDKRSFLYHTTLTWYEMDTALDFRVSPHWVEGG